MEERSDIGMSGTVNSEAEDYVNSVMSSQQSIITQRTPLPSGRKRSLSASAMSTLAETEVKKPKTDDNERGDRPVAKARRNLMNLQPIDIKHKTPKPSCIDREITTDVPSAETSGSTNNTGSEAKSAGAGKGKAGKKAGKALQKSKSEETTLSDTDSDVRALLRKISDDMQNMHDALNKKIDLIESKIEQSEKRITERVTDKVTKIIDKRVSTESAKLRKEIDERIGVLREDFNMEMNSLSSRLDAQARHDESASDDIKLRVIVRNLPETINENVKDKIDTVIREGLKIRNVKVVTAERKESRGNTHPGVVIAKFKDPEDKKKVMTSKNALKDSRQYNRVYINHDQSKEERVLANNMRTLINGVKQGQNLRLKGARIVASPGNSGRVDNRVEGRNSEARERKASTERTRNGAEAESRDRNYHRDNAQGDRPSYSNRNNRGHYNPSNRYSGRYTSSGRY